MTHNTNPVSLDIVDDILITCLIHRLAEAIEHHDGDAAIAVLGQLDVVAGREFTGHLVDGLITMGLRRMADRLQADGTTTEQRDDT
jgi:hypothetical protein